MPRVRSWLGEGVGQNETTGVTLNFFIQWRAEAFDVLFVQIPTPVARDSDESAESVIS